MYTMRQLSGATLRIYFDKGIISESTVTVFLIHLIHTRALLHGSEEKMSQQGHLSTFLI